jgi:uncharacterized membrane protein
MTISGGKAKWLVAGIIVSLGLNLLLIGWIAGGRMHGPGFGWHQRSGGPMAIMAGMPREMRAMMKAKFKDHREAHRAEMDAARQILADTLAAEPFDATAFDRALGAMEGIAGQMMSEMRNSLAELVAGMTPEQRREWAEGLRQWKGPH